jgi:16S rRNA (adenine1518-N6/adenine1519-N6)-dimethyltransferase
VAKNRDHRSGNPAGSGLADQTASLLRRYGLHARKGLGQHFLIDEAALETVARAAELMPQDTVVEVGPGLGVLTRVLASKVRRVIAVELDDDLYSTLKKTLADQTNVTMVHGDILEQDPGALLRAGQTGAVSQPDYKVVANLPYYITSPVLRHFLEAATVPRLIVVMVQKEVAEQIVAPPGRMSLLSVSVQFYGAPSVEAYVPARAFQPPPKVDSAILKIRVYDRPRVSVDSTAGFFQIVRAGFTTPRKQIVNSLMRGLGRPREEVLDLLRQARVLPTRRAETLTLDEWSTLYQAAKIGLA